MVRSREYWIKRQSQLFNSQIKEDDKFTKKLEQEYVDQQNKIQKDMADFYAKYGEDNVIRYRDMLQGLNSSERDQFYQQHNRFIQDHPDLADVVSLDIPIYQMNRFEALEMSVKRNMLELGVIEQEAYEQHLRQAYERGYLKTMENLGNPQAMFGVSDEVIRQTMSKKWVAGRNFSDSIWTNKEGLTNALTTRLRDGFIRGDSYQSMTKILQDRFDVGKNEARRLVQTEAAFIMNQANSHAFQAEGIERYSLSAVLDDRTSEICNEMDGEVFYFKDMRIGENAPPFHAYCRTMIIPVENDVQLTDDSDIIELEFSDSIVNKLSEEEIMFYKELAAEATPDSLSLWNRYKDDLVLFDRSPRNGGAFYRKGEGVTIDILDDLKGTIMSDGTLLMKKGNTFFHEFGHHIDDLSQEGRGLFDSASSKVQLSNGKSLGKTIFDEINVRINEQPSKRKLDRKSELKDKLLSDFEKEPSVMGSLSDLFGGATKNQVRLNMGHSKDYWEGNTQVKRWLKYNNKTSAEFRDSRLGSEAFAEMYAAEMMDPDEVRMFEKWLPESYSMYKELTTKLLGG